MRGRFFLLIAASTLVLQAPPALEAQGSKAAGRKAAARAGHPPVASQVTFLYFNDLDKAAAFYEKTLGFHATFDQDWVKIYTLSPTSSVGLVDATHGAHKPSSDKPVMVSLVVNDPGDVDGWYEYLKSKGVSVKPPSETGKAPVRAIEFKDPEGHTLEVFAWLKK